MLLNVLAFLILFFVLLTPLFLIWFIYYHLSKDRELNQEREDRVIDMAKRVEQVAMLAVKTEQIVIDHQLALDRKIDELTRSLTEYNIFMDLQLEKFHDLALSDATTARRYELMRTKEVKSMLERLMSITTMSRQPPVGSDVIALEAATSRIDELEDILDNNSLVRKGNDNV